MTDSRPKLALFVDRQNVYRGAREVFGFDNSFHTKGQVNPLQLGQLIAARNVNGHDRRLTSVRIYRGVPDSRRSPRGNAAYFARGRYRKGSHQDSSKSLAGRCVIPRGWPKTREHEKGIDVQLAIDFVLGYVRGDFDVGVLFSGDTTYFRPLMQHPK